MAGEPQAASLREPDPEPLNRYNEVSVGCPGQRGLLSWWAGCLIVANLSSGVRSLDRRLKE